MNVPLERLNSRVAIAALFTLCLTIAPALAALIKNIVPVHGICVDGSGWKGVYDILVKDAPNIPHES